MLPQHARYQQRTTSRSHFEHRVLYWLNQCCGRRDAIYTKSTHVRTSYPIKMNFSNVKIQQQQFVQCVSADRCVCEEKNDTETDVSTGLKFIWMETHSAHVISLKAFLSAFGATLSLSLAHTHMHVHTHIIDTTRICIYLLIFHIYLLAPLEKASV